MNDVLEAKTQAAQKAVSFIKSGMVIGLGTGSTAKIAIDIIGQLVAGGLKIVGIPTSVASDRQARALGIPLTTLDEAQEIDVTIDGADQVDSKTRTLIKGLGGALLREKLVAAASKQLVIIVDESKITEHLGKMCPVPVEIIPFAWTTTFKRLEKIGANPKARRNAEGELFLSDGGNYILDCHFQKTIDANYVQSEIKSLLGVVETGLFIGMNPQVVIGSAGNARLL